MGVKAASEVLLFCPDLPHHSLGRPAVSSSSDPEKSTSPKQQQTRCCQDSADQLPAGLWEVLRAFQPWG